MGPKVGAGRRALLGITLSTGILVPAVLGLVLWLSAIGAVSVCMSLLMELRRAYENHQPIQRPDKLIAWLPKDSRPRQLGRQSV
jgi:hypothetical protein